MSTNWNFNVKLILYSTQYAQVVLYTFKKKTLKSISLIQKTVLRVYSA